MWADSGKPLTVLVPEHDDYLRPPRPPSASAWCPQARVVGVDGAKHLWVGEKYAARVLNEIVDDVTATVPAPQGCRRSGRPGGHGQPPEPALRCRSR